MPCDGLERTRADWNGLEKPNGFSGNRTVLARGWVGCELGEGWERIEDVSHEIKCK